MRNPWFRLLEDRVTAVWYSSGPGLLWCLLPLMLIYRAVVRRRLARRTMLACKGDKPAVVVVGGITVGGTGKTPVVIALIDALVERGFKVGVVSRGYGSIPATEPRIVEPTMPASLVGDETLLLARRGCPVVVCLQRSAAITHLTAQYDLDIVLSDDGLQHYAMARTFEIAVLDQHRGLGNGWMLPMGPLREPASRLHSVDTVLVRNGTNPDTRFCYRYDGFVHLATGRGLPLADAISDWAECGVSAATGLGQPEQFFDSLRAFGLIVEPLTVGDHQPLSTKALAGLTGNVIVITEKDAVKLPRAMDSSVLQRLWVLPIRAQLPPLLIDRIVEVCPAQERT